MCISRFKHFPIVLCNLFQRAWLSLEQDSTNARFYRQAALTQQHAGWMRTGKHFANAPTSTKETEYVAAWRMGPVAPKRSKRVLKGASASGIFASAIRQRVWLTKKLLRYKLGTSISAWTNVLLSNFQVCSRTGGHLFSFSSKDELETIFNNIASFLVYKNPVWVGISDQMFEGRLDNT